MRVLMMPDSRQVNPYQKLLADGLQAHGVEVRFAGGYKRGLPFWRAWRAERGARVLHLHWINPYLRGGNVLTQAAYCARLLLDIALVRASGGSVVWTIHNRVSHESKWPGLERWVQRSLAKTVDRVIVHAKASLAELRQDFPLPDDQVSVVPHGHYRTAYGAEVAPVLARQELGIATQGRVFLCFGMLRPYKGIERLIEAWKACPAQGGTLLIAGTPCDEAFLARLKGLAAECSSIKIRAAFVPPERIPLIFGAADLVVLPFSSILTSGSLLLAMSYGKPVIAPRFGGIVEALGDAADLLYDNRDSAGLPDALARAAAMDLEPLRARTEKMCDGLDWTTVGGLTNKAYLAAMGRAPLLQTEQLHDIH